MRKALLGAVAVGGVGIMAIAGLPGPASAAGWNASVLVSTLPGTEPGIEIATDGTMYIHAPHGLPGVSYLWRSDNGGTSWTLTPNLTRDGAYGGGDSDIGIDPVTGRLVWTDLSIASAGVAMSTDKGNTWVGQPFTVPIQDRQWVAATPGNNAYHVTHQIGSGLVVNKSVDGGITYPVATYAATVLDQNLCVCPPGGLIAEGTGAIDGTTDKVGVIYTTSTGVGFSRSSDGGITWTRSTVDPTGGGSTSSAFPTVANAGGGNLHAAWMEINGASSRIGYSKSTNWGANWSAPTWIVTTGTPVFPWIDARGSKVGVALYHTTSTGSPSSVPSSAQWFVKYLESANGGSTWGALETADPTVAKNGPVCLSGINCGSGRELGDFLGLAIDPAGKANISYDRSTSGITVRTVKQS